MQTNQVQFERFFTKKWATSQPILRLVCSGGGAKGVVYPGAYKALQETGVFKQIRDLSGASAGAIAVTFMAVGMPAVLLRQALLNRNFKALLGQSVSTFFGKNPAGVSLFTKDGKPLLQFIRDNLVETVRLKLNDMEYRLGLSGQNADFKAILSKFQEHQCPCFTFGDLAVLNRLCPEEFKQLTIPAVQFPNGEVQVFNSQQTPDVEIALACRASASLPIILEPVEIDVNGQKSRFVDVGIYDNIPADYFDLDASGRFIKNAKPMQTLVLVFSEGFNEQKNPVFKALYGHRWDEVMKGCQKPILSNQSILETIKYDNLTKILGSLQLSYKVTVQGERGYHKLRSEYPLRSVELRVGALGALSFELATKQSRVMDAFGYLDTINFITNHELHDKAIFDSEGFFVELMDDFMSIYQTRLMTIVQDSLMHKLIVLRTELIEMGKDDAVICRQLYQIIRDYAGRDPDSSAAFALSRAVECRSQSISGDALLKETKAIGSPHRSLLSSLIATGESLFRSIGGGFGA